ncbi:hypothetical protein Btru_051573, partial [Bulinus truncatus]
MIQLTFLNLFLEGPSHCEVKPEDYNLPILDLCYNTSVNLSVVCSVNKSDVSPNFRSVIHINNSQSNFLTSESVETRYITIYKTSATVPGKITLGCQVQNTAFIDITDNCSYSNYLQIIAPPQSVPTLNIKLSRNEDKVIVEENMIYSVECTVPDGVPPVEAISKLNFCFVVVDQTDIIIGRPELTFIHSTQRKLLPTSKAVIGSGFRVLHDSESSVTSECLPNESNKMSSKESVNQRRNFSSSKDGVIYRRNLSSTIDSDSESKSLVSFKDGKAWLAHKLCCAVKTFFVVRKNDPSSAGSEGKYLREHVKNCVYGHTNKFHNVATRTMTCRDTGIYECQAYNGNRSAGEQGMKKYNSIFVNSPLHLNNSADTDKRFSPKVGESFVHTVTIYGYPEPNNITVLKSDSTTNNFKVQYQPNELPYFIVELKMENVKKSDFGNYTAIIYQGGNQKLHYSFSLSE